MRLKKKEKEKKRVRRATSFRWRADSLQLGRSYTACLRLISGATHSTAPTAGDQLVRAHHLNSFYKFPPNLLLRRPSHNYCCSAPIVQQKDFSLNRGKQPPTEIRNFFRAEFPCFGAHSAAFTKFASDISFLFFTVVSVSHKERLYSRDPSRFPRWRPFKY